jgi:fructan beta-fructosidase
MPRLLISLVFLIVITPGKAQEVYHEKFRPQIHFSPMASWMNDPNGLIYSNGTYHLFFQYYPDSTVWGPMHWGHATSSDLIHWKQLGIALYPDSLGYIFSGSAVTDTLNTSGFGSEGKIPMIAIYTQHDPVREQGGKNNFQNQSIAYSLDSGKSWTKYSGNPVLKTPGLRDFRDPKVSWYQEQNKWIMALAAGDRIMFYSSTDLKSWKKESEFGAGIGAHGGVWECPDIVPFFVEGKKIWLLIVNINPGGVQGGSGTQYFTGDFDGHVFTSNDTITRWMDYGSDNYAGVTFGNTGNEKIFLGWMSNWLYGTKVPTERWRSAMTIPRILVLKKLGKNYYSAMFPVNTINRLITAAEVYKHSSLENGISFSGPTQIEFEVSKLHSFSLVFKNGSGQSLKTGYDEEKKSFYVDRRLAGKSDFVAGFANIQYGPRLADTRNSKIVLILDNSSLELFADGGLTTMTEIFFPDSPFNYLQQTGDSVSLNEIKISHLSSIWPK